MIRFLAFGFALLIVAGSPTAADTFHMTNGVSFDGVVLQENPDGTMKVQAGSNVLVYRKIEIEQVEKNDKTGKFDKEAALAEWAKEDAALTEATGLNAAQRAQVKALLFKLMRGEDTERLGARERLVALQGDMDVFRYLAYELPGMAYTAFPYVLDAMFIIDPGRTLPHLRESVINHAPAARAKAIELLGKARDLTSLLLVARGLVDPGEEVRIMAAYALANLGAKQASPALIDGLKHPDLRVNNASRESLQALWKDELGDQKLATIEEWTAFWQAHAGSVSSPIETSALTPLVDPEVPFVAG